MASLHIKNSDLIYHIWNTSAHKNFKFVIDFEDEDYIITQLDIFGHGDVSLILNDSLFQKRFRDITKLNCLNFKLVNFTKINNNIEYIWFYNLNIHYLELHYFKNLYKLKILKIFFNNISVIQNFTFNDLHKLNHLNLTNNNIEHIESRAFAGL